MIAELLQASPWLIFICHLLLAIFLFFLMNWIGANSITVGYVQLSLVAQDETSPAFNFIFKVFSPIIYLIICAVTFQSLKIDILIKNCFLIVVYYWGLRVSWILFTNRGKLTDWGQQVIYWFFSIGTAIWLYSIIENVEKILPDSRALLDQMWILIIAFLYAVFNKMHVGIERTIKRKNNYIDSRYRTFKAEYDPLIKGFFNNHYYEALTYALMIYEDFNRPYLVRKIENLSFKLKKKTHTLGIMQVKTNTFITDRQSIEIAMKKIKYDNNNFIKNTKPNKIYGYDVLNHILKEYNGGYPQYYDEVEAIFKKIMHDYYNDQYPEEYTFLSE